MANRPSTLTQLSQYKYSKTDISVQVFQDRYLSFSIPRQLFRSQYSKTDISVPVFDDAVPARSGHLGGFVGVPEDADADVIMSFELAVQLGALPVPYVHLSVSIPT